MLKQFVLFFISITVAKFSFAAPGEYSFDIEIVHSAPTIPVVELQITDQKIGKDDFLVEKTERNQFIDSSLASLKMLFEVPAGEVTSTPMIIGASAEMTARLERVFDKKYNAQYQVRRIVSLSFYKARQLGLESISISIPAFSNLPSLDAHSFVQGIRSSIQHSSRHFNKSPKVFLVVSEAISQVQLTAIESELSKPYVDLEQKIESDIVPKEIPISPKTAGVVEFPYDSYSNHLVEARFAEALGKGWQRLSNPGSGLSAPWLAGRVVAGINFTDGATAKLNAKGIFVAEERGSFGVRFKSTLFWGRIKSVVPDEHIAWGFWATLDTAEGEKTISIRSTDLVHVFPTSEDARYIEEANLIDIAYNEKLEKERKLLYEEWSRSYNFSAIFANYQKNRRAGRFLYELHDLANRRTSEQTLKLLKSIKCSLSVGK